MGTFFAVSLYWCSKVWGIGLVYFPPSYHPKGTTFFVKNQYKLLPLVKVFVHHVHPHLNQEFPHILVVVLCKVVIPI